MNKFGGLTKRQVFTVYMIKAAQKTVRVATLNKVRPIWVLPTVAHFANENRKKQEQLESSDSDPFPSYSLAY